MNCFTVLVIWLRKKRGSAIMARKIDSIQLLMSLNTERDAAEAEELLMIMKSGMFSPPPPARQERVCAGMESLQVSEDLVFFCFYLPASYLKALVSAPTGPRSEHPTYQLPSMSQDYLL